MTYEDTLKEKGYVITESNISDWDKDTFTAINHSTFIYCIAGSVTIEINMIEYTLRTNSYVSIPDDSIVKVISRSDDFNSLRLAYTKDAGLTASIGMNIDTMQNIFLNPCNHLTNATEIALFMNMLGSLLEYSRMPNFLHHSDFAYGQIRCLFLAIAEIGALSRNAASQSTVFTSADSYFINFIKLLNKHCRQQHDVAFYADKLSITPKYLNEIARKTANRTAKDIISKFIVARIKRELLISGNSVQRIAYDFNFCDQSSLGKFFKKATGMSPVAFRHSHQ